MNIVDFPIDFVISWVDGSDKEWLKKKASFSSLIYPNNNDDNENRYRDFGLLKNWFERVWKFAPWVNRVFLVTDDQAPLWAKKDKRIQVINHTDFIPSKFLPTFNSNAIEMNLWRIKDLSEHFVYFNDDMYIANPVYPNDFFSNKGAPILNGGLWPVVPRDLFSKIIFNNMIVVNKLVPKKKFFKNSWRKHFSFKSNGITGLIVSLLSFPFSNWLGFYEDHLAYPNLKSWFLKLYQRYPEIFNSTSSHRIRNYTDYSIWLLKNLYIASGNFEPRNRNFGVVIGIRDMHGLKEIQTSMRKNKIVVINDSLDDYEAKKVIKNLKWLMEAEK